VLDRLPIGSTGKTDRTALLALLERPEVDPAARSNLPAAAGEALAVSPSELTDGIAAIWCDVLSVPRVSPADNFIDLGGNSILAMQVAARIQQRFSRPVEAADVLLAETLTDLGAQVERSVAAG